MGVEMLRPPMLSRVAFRDTAVSSRLQLVAAVLSFIIYASAVVVLQQHHDNSFCCERIGLAAAVSDVVYGAPLGKVYPEIQTQLFNAQAPIEAVLERVAQLDPQPTNPTMPVSDGNGIGFIIAASSAMRLFGPHLFSLPFFMLALMAISTATFLWRFGDNRSAVVTVTFFALTLMLCTPLVWDPGIANQIPIGGIRYFSLLAIVPSFHLVLELADGNGQADGARRLHTFVLAVQVILLVLAILVRGSAASAAGPILLVGLVKVWRNRANRFELRSLCRKGTVIATVGAVFAGSLLLALPSRYVRDGLVGTVFWHRVVISLGVNPAWPFGNLHEIYDCKVGDIPEGLVAGAVDRDGHCIWWHYLVTYNVPADVALTELYGRRYEAAMGAAFFDILRHYPADVLATFFYYKPKWFVQSMKYLALNPAFHSPVVNVLVIAGFVNFLGFLMITASLSAKPMMLRLAGLGAIFGVFSLPSYLVAWATPHTTADVLFYCLFCIGLGLAAVMEPMRAAVRRAFSESARV